MESRVTGNGTSGQPEEAGSIELNWDCLSNFEEKRDPSFSMRSSVWVAPRKCDLFWERLRTFVRMARLAFFPSSYKAPWYSVKKRLAAMKTLRFTANSSDSFVWLVLSNYSFHTLICLFRDSGMLLWTSFLARLLKSRAVAMRSKTFPFTWCTSVLVFHTELPERNDDIRTLHVGLVAVIRNLKPCFTDPSTKLEYMCSSVLDGCFTTLAELVTSL